MHDAEIIKLEPLKVIETIRLFYHYAENYSK